ncbi:WD40 domain-containing protein [Nocardia aurantiaca]|uniref:TIR domain-containing protein n=1 Tax=Nocardia aurantiaca TaxID=2675850 RepID=A0A6I3KUF1_9NOCA|nr:TIR domain-containing protein [Nocardia aurantiaca]
MTLWGGRSRMLFTSYSPADERWAIWLAWQLEHAEARYRTMVSSWDFDPATNYGDFVQRGVRESDLVVAVLTRDYVSSRHANREWQAALDVDPGKVLAIRVSECSLEWLPTGVCCLDLLGVDSEAEMRREVLDRVERMLSERWTPRWQLDSRADDIWSPATESTAIGRRPLSPPAFPADMAANRPHAGLSILHVGGPRFGRGLPPADIPTDPEGLQSHIWGAVTELVDRQAPPPDLIVVSGDLTESAHPTEFRKATSFLTGLRVLLKLEPDRLVVVPGNHDISKLACRAHFLDCEANDRLPRPPYFAKLRLFEQMFNTLYRGLDHLVFDVGQPWTLFPVPELRLVVAGLNSTMAATHRPEDDYGFIGTEQKDWFSEQLRAHEAHGWFRLGVVRHDPAPGPGTSPYDAGVLRDSERTFRRLGPRLNLLLRGPGRAGRSLAHPGGTLPVLSAPAPGQAELVHITADGLTRYRCDDPHETPVPQQVTWTNCVVALESRAVRPELPAAPPEPRRPEHRANETARPHDMLLEQVAEVCEVRYPGARIRRIASDPPYLLVTVKSEPVIEQLIIGAHVGEVTGQVLDEFLGPEPKPGSQLIYLGPAPRRELLDRAAAEGVRIRSFPDFQGMANLGEYLRKQSARLRDDPAYAPDLYVPQRFRMLAPRGREVQNDLVAELMSLVTADDGRFVLLLGDFGLGKTFALRELTRRITDTATQLVPILIELRELDRTSSLDTLLAAHLADNGESRIDLRALRYMLEQGRVVLLFDGFDELLTRLNYDSAAEHMATLLQAAVGRAKVVVAGRTQHFKSYDQIAAALETQEHPHPDRYILSVENFTDEQVHAFLVNRYGATGPSADSRMRLLRGIPGLLKLACNPRMLSFMADLDEQRLRTAAGARRIIGPTRLYEEILTSWLSYEIDRSPERASSHPTVRIDELWLAVTYFALRVWETGRPYLDLAELTEVAHTAVEQIDASRLNVAQFVHTLGSRSLIVRAEDNRFGFIHSSVRDWLVAKHVAGQLRDGVTAPAPLAQAQLEPLAVEFLCDLADVELLQAWVERTQDDPGEHEITRTNAARLAARLRISPDKDLRGLDLSREDLSFRNLQQLDFTGAIMTETRLTGAVLDQAVLRGVRLVGAQLDQASLVGTDLRGADMTEVQLTSANLQNADLRGARLHRAQLDQASLVRANLGRADLTGARLARTDLTGVRGEGSRWTRAALLDVVGSPVGTDLAGSGRVPGTPPLTEFAPAAIGVKHGVDTQSGRLPRPLAYSPDGGTVAVGCDSGSVVVYGADTGRTLRTLHGHRARAFAVAYTEKVLVTGSADSTVRIWDAATGTVRKILSGHENWPWPLETDTAGTLLATGDAAGVLRVCLLPDGEQLHEFPPPGGAPQRIYSIAFHRDRVAAAYHDGAVRIWQLSTGAEVGGFRGADGPIRRIGWDPMGMLLAAGGADGALGLWDPATGELIHNLTGHRHIVYALAFHPVEPILASGDTAGGIRLWDTGTGDTLYTRSEHGRARIHWLSFDPAGDMLASGDTAGAVYVRDGRTGAPLHRLTGHTGSIWPFAFRPDGTQLAVVDDQFALRIWDPATGERLHTLTGHGRHVRAVSFNADGTLLAGCGNDGSVRLWDAATGRLTQRLQGSTDGLFTLESGVFSPVRPTQLVTVGNAGRLRVIDIDAAIAERDITVDSAPVWAIAYDPSARFIATANDDDTVTLWTRETGGEHAVCDEHRGRVRSIAFDAAGVTMATGCDDGHIRLWDVESGRLLGTLSDPVRGGANGHRVYGVVFHGDRLASISWDGTVRIWNLAGGPPLHRLDLHRGRLWCLAVDPVSGTLATAGDDLVINLWDITSGTHLHTLYGHRNRVRSLAFDPSGRLLASGGNDGSIMQWSLTEPAGIPELRATLLGLPEGWAAFTPDGRYKTEGLTAGQFWHVIGMCRFEAGELDPYLPQIRQVDLDDPL